MSRPSDYPVHVWMTVFQGKVPLAKSTRSQVSSLHSAERSVISCGNDEQIVNGHPTLSYLERSRVGRTMGASVVDLSQRRATWIVMATDGPALELERFAPASVRVRAIADPMLFASILRDGRPRIVVLATPPAGERDMELVAQERRRRSSLRTIHLSALDDVAARLEALRQGYDDALPQSIDPRELAGRAALLEEQARGRAAVSLEIADDLELDLVAHELRRDGRAVHLRPKEFQLLAMLAAHPGRAFTRRQLLDRVWGLDQVGDPRTVDVHVRWLRSKVEREPDRPVHLVTVRGVGYRLDPPHR